MKRREGTHLCALGVEVVVADNGNVQAMSEGVLQGPRASALCGER